MADSVEDKLVCNYCKQAVLNQLFLKTVESNNPTSFYDWKTTIIFYCGLHYIKSFANAKGIELSSHRDFNIKTESQGIGISPELIINTDVRKQYITLRDLSYHSRYDGHFSEKIDLILAKGRMKDSKIYLENIKAWILPRLIDHNVEVNYNL